MYLGVVAWAPPHAAAESSSTAPHRFLVESEHGSDSLHRENSPRYGRRLLGGSAGVAGLLYSGRFLGRSDQQGSRGDGVPSVEPAAGRFAVSSRKTIEERICHSSDGARTPTGLTRLRRKNFAHDCERKIPSWIGGIFPLGMRWLNRATLSLSHKITLRRDGGWLGKILAARGATIQSGRGVGAPHELDLTH